MRHKFYNATAQDCQKIEQLLNQVMDWVGDTKNLSLDTLPFLTYWITGKTSLASQLQSTNIAEIRQQKYQPLPKQNVDADTQNLIHSSYSQWDQVLYKNSIWSVDHLTDLLFNMAKT